MTLVFLSGDFGMVRATLTAVPAWCSGRLVFSIATREPLERGERFHLTFAGEAVEMEAVCRVLLVCPGHLVADIIAWAADAPLAGVERAPPH